MIQNPAIRSVPMYSKVYAYGMEYDGQKLDRQKFFDMGGEKEHVFLKSKHFTELNEQDIDDVNEHFCQNPCVHVLHDHV